MEIEFQFHNKMPARFHLDFLHKQERIADTHFLLNFKQDDKIRNYF